ncbi:threonylcarbamoyl-AMP synthase [Vibrio azureus]|uniref:Threonylcarbamoyl-AMP synthase n=1 Tax=Vibrio azureus NBRC 104587 TaxID=1219077 RepID=U3C3G9_9VIBR|nr:L-threonylcarbamoyladenylate synthase [Vibrio azureus]AUI84969.1 threonylcarbamoyl-AMP synthase [Vibrio azureus]GAD75989.1 tRNA threonylcarbamoyladenosine biosynthesis protein RimN [Vibrio azureus NBRC 104587]
MNNFELALEALKNGDVLAYPTEGVFGVGCDPDNPEAIQKLLTLKQRPVEKGLILIAASYAQLQPYIDESQLTQQQLERVHATWPGPYTWVMPASSKVSSWVSGQFDSIAVRVTDHPLVQDLCQAFGKPITSTSANLTGQPPCMTTAEVEVQLGQQLVAILDGKTSGRDKPSEIRDAKTGQVLRQG